MLCMCNDKQIPLKKFIAYYVCLHGQATGSGEGGVSAHNHHLQWLEQQ